MLAGTDDHLTRLIPVILNLESTGLTHLESEIRVVEQVGTKVSNAPDHRSVNLTSVKFFLR